jgi:shikimate kinase
VDEVVEKVVGCGITELIKTKGEQYFRSVEKDAVKEAVAGPFDVVSLGGGALLNVETRREVLADCLVVHLSISAEASARRVAADEEKTRGEGRGTLRPLLSPASSSNPSEMIGSVHDRVEKLMKERAGLYDCATIAIDVDEETPEEIAGRIVKLVEELS